MKKLVLTIVLALSVFISNAQEIRDARIWEPDDIMEERESDTVEAIIFIQTRKKGWNIFYEYGYMVLDYKNKRTCYLDEKKKPFKRRITVLNGWRIKDENE